MKLLVPFLLFFSVSFLSFSQRNKNYKIALSYQPSYVIMNYVSTHLLFSQSINVTYSPFDHFSFNLSASTAKAEFTSTKYEYMQINDKSIGISINYHSKKKQSFAPSGNYVGIKFDAGFQNGVSKGFVNVNFSNTPYQVLYYDDQARQRMYVASVIFGRNFIYKERFLIGYGIQWGLIIGTGQPIRNLGKPFFNLGIVL